MPPDHMTGHEGRAGAGRASHTGACARAGLFAVLGTVLATFGHHAVADGTVSWRLVAVLTVAQFAAVWPLARRRYAPVATIAFTLATQEALHLALSYADGTPSTTMPTATTMPMPQHAMHAGHLAAASGDGHSWHHTGAAMTAVHTLAALTVAWLLHRADAGMTAALGTLHTLARAAVSALAQALPRAIADPERALLGLPAGRTGAVFAVAAQAGEDVLEYAVVRRGPPRRKHPPVPSPVPAAPTGAGPDPPVSARSSPVLSVSMPVRPAARAGRRLVVAGAVSLTATLALAAPAAAHAEVEADRPQALAENVTLTFVSEAESASAGFTKVRVVLPAGIAPADVTLGEAPKGWKLTAAADGYTLAGPALKTGVDAEHTIKVRQLPDAEQLVFKTVETYSDGEISRWIELPTGGEEPEQPAPVLELKAAAPGAKPVGQSPAKTQSPAPGATTASAAPSTTESDATPTASDTAADEDDGMSSGVLAGVIAAVLLVLGGGAWWLVKRRTAASSES